MYVWAGFFRFRVWKMDALACREEDIHHRTNGRTRTRENTNPDPPPKSQHAQHERRASVQQLLPDAPATGENGHAASAPGRSLFGIPSGRYTGELVSFCKKRTVFARCGQFGFHDPPRASIRARHARLLVYRGKNSTRSNPNNNIPMEPLRSVFFQGFHDPAT